MTKRSDGCSAETLPAPCTRKKRLQKNVTKDYYWIGAEENIAMFSESCYDRNIFIYLSLFERPVRPMLNNCHIHAMAGHRSASLQVLAASGFCDDRKSTFNQAVSTRCGGDNKEKLSASIRSKHGGWFRPWQEIRLSPSMIKRPNKIRPSPESHVILEKILELKRK